MFTTAVANIGPGEEIEVTERELTMAKSLVDMLTGDFDFSSYKDNYREALLEIIGRDRNWNEAAARHQLLKFFEAWGPKDELTQSARRRLSSLLFS